jgi:hypothetical protein
MVWSDVLAQSGSSGFLGFFTRQKAHIEKIVKGREAAIEVVHYYMDKSREAFESKYN